MYHTSIPQLWGSCLLTVDFFLTIQWFIFIRDRKIKCIKTISGRGKESLHCNFSSRNLACKCRQTFRKSWKKGNSATSYKGTECSMGSRSTGLHTTAEFFYGYESKMSSLLVDNIWVISIFFRKFAKMFASQDAPLVPTTTTPCQIMRTISDCLHLKVNLNKIINLYVNSTTQRCANQIFKIFLCVNDTSGAP